jgi:hypothetical protein
MCHEITHIRISDIGILDFGISKVSRTRDQESPWRKSRNRSEPSIWRRTRVMRSPTLRIQTPRLTEVIISTSHLAKSRNDLGRPSEGGQVETI